MSDKALVQSVEKVAARLRPSLRGADDVALAYLYGSAVKGALRSDSDVDVAVYLRDDGSSDRELRFGVGHEPSPEERVETAERTQELEATLQEDLERPVQVVSLELAPHDLVHNVLRHGHLIVCRDDRLRSGLFVSHARRHFDLVHMREIFDRYRERRIREGTFGGGSRDGS